MGTAPKMPGGSKMHVLKIPNLGTGNGTVTVKLGDYLPKSVYSKLTADQIVIEAQGCGINCGNMGSGGGWANPLNKNYDPNTGVLTFLRGQGVGVYGGSLYLSNPKVYVFY